MFNFFYYRLSKNNWFGFFLIFCLVLVTNLYYEFFGFDNYLLENHAFRQTQTAITTYYFLKNGFSLDYITPVLGYPWKIPFEFPLYQYLVYLIVKYFNLKIEVGGRIISLIFFYSTLVYIFFLFRKIGFEFWKVLIVLSLVLIHPIYIYWSRSFMIESTALFFTIMFLYHYTSIFLEQKISKLHCFFALFSCLVACLVKITTILPLILILSFFTIYFFKKDSLSKKNIVLISMIFMTLIVSKLWINYTDSLKKLNTYAFNHSASTLLYKWNFGTIQDRFCVAKWEKIFNHSLGFLFVFFLLCIGLIVFRKNFKNIYSKIFFTSLILYLLFPLIFFNLHYVHDYYTYSNSIYLIVSIAMILIYLIQCKNRFVLILGFLGFISCLIFFKTIYKQTYFPTQYYNYRYIIKTCEFLKKNTKQNNVVLIYGNDWSSEYAFYSQRKTICLDKNFQSYHDKRFQNILLENKGEKISTLLMVTYFNLYNKKFLISLKKEMDFKPVLINPPFYIYQRVVE